MWWEMPSCYLFIRLETSHVSVTDRNLYLIHCPTTTTTTITVSAIKHRQTHANLKQCALCFQDVSLHTDPSVPSSIPSSFVPSFLNTYFLFHTSFLSTFLCLFYLHLFMFSSPVPFSHSCVAVLPFFYSNFFLFFFWSSPIPLSVSYPPPSFHSDMQLSCFYS